jgi:hypothetical protein
VLVKFATTEAIVTMAVRTVRTAAELVVSQLMMSSIFCSLVDDVVVYSRLSLCGPKRMRKRTASTFKTSYEAAGLIAGFTTRRRSANTRHPDYGPAPAASLSFSSALSGITVICDHDSGSGVAGDVDIAVQIGW